MSVEAAEPRLYAFNAKYHTSLLALYVDYPHRANEPRLKSLSRAHLPFFIHFRWNGSEA